MRVTQAIPGILRKPSMSSALDDSERGGVTVSSSGSPGYGSKQGSSHSGDPGGRRGSFMQTSRGDDASLNELLGLAIPGAPFYGQGREGAYGGSAPTNLQVSSFHLMHNGNGDSFGSSYGSGNGHKQSRSYGGESPLAKLFCDSGNYFMSPGTGVAGTGHRYSFSGTNGGGSGGQGYYPRCGLAVMFFQQRHSDAEGLHSDDRHWKQLIRPRLNIQAQLGVGNNGSGGQMPTPPALAVASSSSAHRALMAAAGAGGSAPGLVTPLVYSPADWNTLQALVTPIPTDPQSLEQAARLYRNAAHYYDATCTWSGQLPLQVHQNPSYSCKVFVGGVPWDVMETTLTQVFRQFGDVKVEWPGKDGDRAQPKGHVYLLFETECQVKNLLNACTHEFSNGGNYYYKINARRLRSREGSFQVQIIPWVIEDSNLQAVGRRADLAQKTVFVGALHGMLTAEALAIIMDDLFSGVLYAGIDTDKHKYPIGSGRVTFNNHKSYMRAVAAVIIKIQTRRFTKKSRRWFLFFLYVTCLSHLDPWAPVGEFQA
ncbi:unnamed protein product [Cyprideis torosa]|uniref:Uncharacterized protein n=1 Tax=Cyprideis torosa TaxID=163714 RepID=A0A7R8ZS65_9CRUS|nr:unnamed protein product [Cyprideis torosa]CAG0900844.1 unnamed protein product [Cyprideis torosa]